VLDGMGQIPITRGSGDAGALDAAIAELRAGSCIGVFPEGTRSLGRTLRPRSGLGRLVAAVPEAIVVPVAVTGTTDITRFPKRPRLRVRFLPAPDGMREGESPSDYAVRVVEEIRQIAPISIAGRKRRKLAAAGAAK
jgi:1-acyl-sn-glycerol-3-phosphate acyltransferase